MTKAIKSNTYWNRNNEHKIYEILLKHKKLHFNKLLSLFYPNSEPRKNPNVLSRYLKKMKSQGIIQKEFEGINKEDDPAHSYF